MPDYHAYMSRCWDSRPCVLIDTICRTDCRTNATTASTVTSKRFPIRVSFELADPPGVSLCFVHCPGGNNRNFIGDPLILTSAQAFVLLVVSFTSTASHDAFHDYFIYTAGPGKPQLHRIPIPYPRDFDHKAVGILPLSDHYSIVIPVSSYNHSALSMEFSFKVFSSKRKAWSTKKALLARDSETDYIKAASHVATEVISFGEGLLGWVDLWWGILLCNVLDENPVMRLLQWPVPEPNLEFFDSNLQLNNISPQPFRNVTVVNGVIKFVELKFHEHTANQGWTATIWSRMVSLLDWHENSKIHSHDVSIIDSILLSQMPFLLPEMLDMEANSLTWDDVICTSPTLSLTNDDVVHLMVKSNLEYPIAFVVTVNTKNKTLEAVEQCCSKKMTRLVPTYMASAFSSYLRTTAGPAPANVLECPYNVAGTNVENNVTVETPLRMPNEQPKRTHVAASYSFDPARKDLTKSSYASIVKQGPPTAVVKPKPLTSEEARISAEQDAAAQGHANNVLQYRDKYEEAMAALAEMEKRAIRAETLLEQYQSSEQKAISPLPSPRAYVQDDSSQEVQPIKLHGSCSLIWCDKSKGKQCSFVDCTVAKLTDMDDEEQGVRLYQAAKYRQRVEQSREQRSEQRFREYLEEGKTTDVLRWSQIKCHKD